METRQRLLDSLTSHLALYHTSKPTTTTAPRASILRWFSALSVTGRRAALTIVDRDIISVILHMLSQLHRFGHGFFFLLPDVPSNFDPSVPSVLFRRSSGLLARGSAGNSAELELGESVLLFSSDESPNSKGLDAVTVSENFVSDTNKFVEVMDKISGGKFLTGDEDYKSPKWPELPWLVDKGYYSLEAYLVNRLEIAIRVSWRESTGGGRKGNIGKSVKDNKFGIASNAFWRKKGCLDWWARLDHTKRDNLVRSFLAQTTRTIANEIVKKYEIDLNNKLYFFNHQSTSCWQTTKQSFFRKNRCSVSLDDISLLPYRRKKALPSVVTRLVALYEISVLKRNFGQYGLDALFFTSLASAGTVRDYMLDKLRRVLMVVSVECTNLELLEDSGTSRPSPPVPSKGKKKASKSRRPKSKPSTEYNLDGDDNKAINCVNKEPKASSDELAVQEKSENMPISKENKENAEVSVENKGPSTKTKNKRKGKNKSATSSKSKTLESNKTKNPNSCTNTTPSLNATNTTNTATATATATATTTATTTTTTIATTTTSTNSSNNNTDNISSVLTNSNDSPSKIENSKSCNNPSKSGNPIPETPNRNQIPPPNQTRYFELQNQNQTDTNPPPNFDPLFVPQIIPPPVLPLSYDWPPMYRNYNKLTQYVGPATYEFNQFLDDTETYWYSEEEADTKYSYSRRGYGQIFGGGVMYWSPSEYINGNNSNGPFSSRPPSMSSDDSAWGRHEADIVQIIDEITVPGGEVTLDEIPPHQQIDSLPYSMLRPIIIPSRPSRRGSTSSSSARRDNSRAKRPPSPVVLCVPRVPRPPPPSPVAEGSRRRGGSGFTVVRSGSSSPRNWAVRGLYCEENGNMEKGRGVLVGPEVVWTNLVHKGGCLDRGAANPVLQEHLIQISQWDQHPDIALPLQPPESVNSAARISMHNLLHEEIDYFCKQVGARNLTRKPYINWAVNRVTKCLQVLWPRSRTNIFGSNVTGLALPTSDVDLVISLPPVRNLEPIKEAGILEGRNGIKETCLQHAARYLVNQEWVRSESLKTIENTAIPIIMLVAQVPYDINFCNETPIISDNLQEYPSNVLGTEQDGAESSAISKDCTVVKSIRLDISFKSSSHTGLQTSELVRELTEQFPASVPLALVLKKFLADRSLDHSYSGGLSSYCLVLLITRFLQHEHHVGQPMNQNLGRLLMDFLYFFGNVFDPRQMRTSIQGRGLYMNRERGLSIDPIHIDDPIYPVNNVGRNCFRIHQCIKAFADAFSMLENEVENFSGESSSATSASQLRLLRKIIPSIDSYE